MKITKRQLRRIIKEARKTILNEQVPRWKQLEKIEDEVPNAVVIDFGMDAEYSAVRATDSDYLTVHAIKGWLRKNGFSVASRFEDSRGVALVLSGPNVYGGGE